MTHPPQLGNPMAVHLSHNGGAAAGEDLPGMLMVGHGTRQRAGQEQMRQVFADFARFVAPYPAELAFLELAEPDIATAMSSLAARGVRRVITIPVLLFTAGHALEDIPGEVRSAAGALGIDCAGQTPSLHQSRPLLELSAERFRQAVCTLPLAAPGLAAPHDASSQVCGGVACQQHCSGRWCSQAGLLMVGRGSKSEEATAAMRGFTAKRLKLTPTAWHETAFVFGQEPTVEAGLQRLADCELPLAVVQPHLLFEGELINNLRRQVAEQAERFPHKRWIITETLGTDERLGRMLAKLAWELVQPSPGL